MAQGLEAHVWQKLEGIGPMLVAVSGGMDSMVLLHIAHRLSLQHGLRVEAAHFEHGIRGEESLRDMRFVKSACETLGIVLHVGNADVPGIARRCGENLEQCARRLRYAYLRQTMAQRQLNAILTAHHQRDQAETVLLHLIRGSSLKGISGMQERNGAVLRPLLDVPYTQLEAYAGENDLQFVVDQSNEDTAYSRNRVRREILPSMEAINPRAQEAITRLAQEARQADEYLHLLAREYIGRNLNDEMLRLDADTAEPVLKRAVKLYLEDMGCRDVQSGDISRAIELALLPSGKRATICGQLYEAFGGYILKVEKEKGYKINVEGPGEYALPHGGAIEIKVVDVPDSLDLGRDAQLFDQSILSNPIHIRPFEQGDRYTPFGKTSEKLVSDLFTDRKIPRARRGQVPLVVCGGQIIFIAPLARASGYLVDSNSKTCVQIRYKRE